MFGSLQPIVGEFGAGVFVFSDSISNFFRDQVLMICMYFCCKHEILPFYTKFVECLCRYGVVVVYECSEMCEYNINEVSSLHL